MHRIQDVDSHEDGASTSSTKQEDGGLPVVPIPPPDRQLLLSRLPADVAPTLKAAAESLSGTSDAQVGCAVSLVSFL